MRPLFSVLAISFSLAASAATVPDHFETIAKQAETARSQERVPEAIRLYREGTKLRPSWADGWWYLGSLLYDQDRFPEATAAFQHLFVNTSHRGPAHAFLGLCDYETGKYDDALAQFRAWAGAGWAGTRELRDVAMYHFALLLTRDGKFVESLYLIAPLAQRLGDNPELVEAMGLASLRMTYLPENYPPELRERIWLAGKAALYAAQSPKDFERADEFAERLESRYGTQPEIHYFRGTLYGFEGKDAEAGREYREELKISPEHAPSLVALAGFDLEKSDLAEAGALARRAVAADSNNAEAHHLLGRVLLETGDLRASVSELETAKQLAPDSPLVRSHLAMVYTKLGRTQEAKVEAAAFLALKSKEEVMASPEEKLGVTLEKAH
jgi:tetratricopeptide (TPR) repeat protein